MRAASAYADLVFHGLAFVPVSERASSAARAASLHWPAYVAFVKRELPPDAYALLEEDALVLSKLFEPTPIAHAIGWLAELHASIDDFLSFAPKDLAALQPSEIASNDALASLCALPSEAVEILRADLAIVARAFAKAHAERFVPHLERARARIAERELGVLSRLALGDVELSATLGLHGRGFPNRVIVGTWALPGEEMDPDPTLVYAVHEIAVQRASEVLAAAGRAPVWADVEALALAVEAQLLRATPLEAAFERWSAAISREGLTDLVAGGLEPHIDGVRLALDVGKVE